MNLNSKKQSKYDQKKNRAIKSRLDCAWYKRCFLGWESGDFNLAIKSVVFFFISIHSSLTREKSVLKLLMDNVSKE